jgi:hypothetical protein
MRRTGLAGQGVLLAALGTLVAARAQAVDGGPEELRPRYAGEWRFSGDAAQRAAVPAAVEHSVDGMFFIARGIAYDRLIHVCEICSSYRVRFTPGEVEIQSPCQLPDKSPDDGREVDHVTKAGDASKLSQRFVAGMLVQEFRGEEGARRVVWRVEPASDSLSIQVTITSKHLPNPVEYTLSYRRAPTAAPASPASGPRDAGPPGG